MIYFLFLAALLNLTPLLLFAAFRHRVARWPQPGLWWMGVVALTLVGTLLIAQGTL